MAASTEYTDTLKKIKETEEQGAKELTERRKVLEDGFHRLEEDSANSLAAARSEAEEYISNEVAKARADGELDAKQMLSSNTKEAEATATKKLDKRALAKIVDEILSEFKEA